MADNNKKPEQSKFSLSGIYKTHLAEFKRIIWPSRDEVIKQTITVIFISIIIGLIIMGLDFLFEQGFMLLGELFGKLGQ